MWYRIIALRNCPKYSSQRKASARIAVEAYLYSYIRIQFNYSTQCRGNGLLRRLAVSPYQMTRLLFILYSRCMTIMEVEEKNSSGEEIVLSGLIGFHYFCLLDPTTYLVHCMGFAGAGSATSLIRLSDCIGLRYMGPLVGSA